MDTDTSRAAAHIAMQLYVRGGRSKPDILGERPFEPSVLEKALSGLIERDYVVQSGNAYILSREYREDIRGLFPIR